MPTTSVGMAPSTKTNRLRLRNTATTGRGFTRYDIPSSVGHPDRRCGGNGAGVAALAHAAAAGANAAFDVAVRARGSAPAANLAPAARFHPALPADARHPVARPGGSAAAMGTAATGVRPARRRRGAGGGARSQPEHGRPSRRGRADRAGANRGRQLSALPAGADGQSDSGGRGRRGFSTRPRPISTPCATNWPAAACCRSGSTSIGRSIWPPACWRRPRRTIGVAASWCW